MRTRLIVFLLALAAAVPSFAAITGTVMTIDGKPVAGAKVSVLPFESSAAMRARLLSKSPEQTPLATAETDAKGNFTLPSPKEPAVAVTIMARGYAPASRTAERDEELGAIALRLAETVKGSVRANGKPVAGATVIWSGGDEVEEIATTDAAGNYSVAEPARWARRVTVIHPDYALASDPVNEKTAVDRTLVAGREHKGRVVAADGTTPVANAGIVVDGWPLATTGEDGSFTIAHIAPKWSRMEAHSGNLVASRASTDTSTTLRLGKSAAILGTVVDSKSRVAVPGAQVSLFVDMRFAAISETASTITDAKGNFAFNGLAADRYRLAGEHPSYSVEFAPVAAVAGQSVSKTLNATPMARISGVVVDEQKNPIAAAVVRSEAPRERMRGFMGPMMFNASRAMSGPDGRFIAKTADEGSLTLTAAKKGYPNGTADNVKVAAGERKSGVVITIPRGYELTGRVTDRDDRPLSGVTVRATEAEPGSGVMAIRRTIIMGGPRDDEDDLLVTTASDGTFTIRLKEGTYDIALKRSGFATKTVPTVAVGANAKPIEATLEPSVEITGRIVRNGAGIEGVNIFAFGGGEVVRPVTSGPDGSFTLADLSPGTLNVNFSKTDDFVDVRRNLTAPARDVVIDLPAGGRITGRVVDKNTKQPVTTFNAGISMTRSGGGMMMVAPPQLRPFTSDDGSFVLENVPAGPMTVTASAPGYVTGTVPNVQVEEGKTVSNIEVALDTGTRVTGRVTGPNGSPLAGVSVRNDSGNPAMARMREFSGEGSATTDANGEFAFEAVTPGEKTFAFSHPKYLDGEKTVNVTGREVRLDMQLSNGMDVRGVVVSESGAPVADAMVVASGGTGSFSRARTDANGAFELTSLSPGRYNFEAQKAGLATANVRDFDISGGAPVRLVMTRGAVIYGHVSGLAASELADGVVEARGTDGTAASRIDGSGNYRIEGAPAGTVRVVATARTFPERRTSPQQTVTIEAGESRQIDIEFRGDVVIRGRVTRNGRAAGSVGVMFQPRAGTMKAYGSTTTDDAGNYSIAGLEEGEYTVQVMDMQRLAPYRTTFTVRGSDTFDIDMKVATVRGHVTDSETGEPVEGARIQFRPAAGDTPFATLGGMTDASGMYLIDSVAPGPYSVSADKEGFGNQLFQTTIGEEGRDDLDFKISRNDGVTLTIVDARDQRAIGGGAFVLDAAGRIVYDDGFRFGGSGDVRLSLAPGSYRAVVGAMGYATRVVPITSPGKQRVELTPGGTIAVRSNVNTQRRARLIDASGQPYYRGMSRQPLFALDASAAPTTLTNVAPGAYVLQVLGDTDAVVDQRQVVVVEGQTVSVEM